MRGRVLTGLATTIVLACLITFAAAAQGAQVMGAGQTPVIPADGTGLSSRPADTPGSSHASVSAFATYLPAVLRGYPGCATIPTLIAPVNGSTLSTITPLYQWDDGSSPFATSVRLELARNAAFTDMGPSLRTQVHGSSEHRFSTNLSPATTYYWRVYLICGTMKSPYSPVWSFTTGSGGTVLPAPVLVAPADGSALPGTTATVEWLPVPGVVEYLLHRREVGEGGYNYEWLSATQRTWSWLDSNTNYEWWVSARNDYAIGTDSEMWQFITGSGSSSVAGQGLHGGSVVEDGSATHVLEE
jgi:hypothetical protein